MAAASPIEFSDSTFSLCGLHLGMKLQQLRAFLAVLDLSSFSEAALDLGTSQSTVSYAVAELERDLGVKLLARGRFGAEPTEVGLKVAGHARAIFALTDAVQQEADLSKGCIQGTLKVATFRSAAGKILPKAISRLKKLHPGLKVRLLEFDNELSPGETKRQLVKDHLADVAFVDLLAEKDGLIAWELMRDPYRALLHTSDPREVFAWSEVGTVPLIFCDHTACGSYVKQHALALGLEVRPAYDVKEDSTILRMVSEGLGVGMLPEFAIDELPDNVKAIPLDSLLERPIYIAIAPGGLKVPAVRAFLNVLKTQFPASELLRLEPQRRIQPV